MDDESKKPCAPVEEESRDYNELGLYLHGKTMQTAMELWRCCRVGWKHGEWYLWTRSITGGYQNSLLGWRNLC